MSRTKLPKIFWLLIGLSLFTFFVLLVGSLMEGDWGDFLKWLRRGKVATAPPAAPACQTLSSGTLLRPPESLDFQLLNWNLKSEKSEVWLYFTDGSLALYDLTFDSAWKPKMTERQKKKFFCLPDEKTNCLADLPQLKSGLPQSRVVTFDGAFAGVWHRGAGSLNANMAFFVNSDNGVVLKSFLGLCGKPPGPQTIFSNLSLPARNLIHVSDLDLGLIGIFDLASLFEPIPLGTPPKPFYLGAVSSSGQVQPVGCRSLPAKVPDLVTSSSSGAHLFLAGAGQDTNGSMATLQEFDSGALKKIWAPEKHGLKMKVAASEFPHPNFLLLRGRAWIGNQVSNEIFYINDKEVSRFATFKSSQKSALAAPRDTLLVDRFGRPIKGADPKTSTFLSADPSGFFRKTLSLNLVQSDKAVAWSSMAVEFLAKDLESVLWDRLPGDRHMVIYQHHQSPKIEYQLLKCSQEGPNY